MLVEAAVRVHDLLRDELLFGVCPRLLRETPQEITTREANTPLIAITASPKTRSHTLTRGVCNDHWQQSVIYSVIDGISILARGLLMED